MSRHDDSTRFRHMLSHAQEAVKMVEGLDHGDLAQNRQLNLALVRLLEIIGEAAAHVSETAQQGHPEIPWLDIIGLRNRLIHGYDLVDLDILWDIVQDDLPPLIENIGRILSTK